MEYMGVSSMMETNWVEVNEQERKKVRDLRKEMRCEPHHASNPRLRYDEVSSGDGFTSDEPVIYSRVEIILDNKLILVEPVIRDGKIEYIIEINK